MTRFRLWAQIGITLAVNMLLLALLAGAVLMQQTRGGLESLIFTAGRERIRELGRIVEEEFPGKTIAERSALLQRLEKPYRVTLSVYEDTGELIAGPDLRAPDEVMREIQRGTRPRRPDRAMFLLKEDHPSRYWAGFRIPIVKVEGRPPVRHTLTIVAPSLMTSALFVDLTPWIAAISFALVVTVLCWIPFVRRLTRSINAITLAAGEIAEGRFEVKLANNGQDELGDLSASIRRMAEQLSRLVNGQRRFLADIAHELCAPLSRIQLSSGILEQRAAGADKQDVRRLERDVAHMSALVGDLLSFTKGAVRKPKLLPVNLEQLVKQIVEQERTQALDLQVVIDSTITVLADREYLARAVGNVIRNAIRYAGDAGPIHVGAQRTAQQVHLRITDSGPGLPESELEAVFTPFYRPDTARTPGQGGAGLGLAIVKGSIEACGGRVWCRNRVPFGLDVVIELKAA